PVPCHPAGGLGPGRLHGRSDHTDPGEARPGATTAPGVVQRPRPVVAGPADLGRHSGPRLRGGLARHPAGGPAAPVARSGGVHRAQPPRRARRPGTQPPRARPGRPGPKGAPLPDRTGSLGSGCGAGRRSPGACCRRAHRGAPRALAHHRCADRLTGPARTLARGLPRARASGCTCTTRHGKAAAVLISVEDLQQLTDTVEWLNDPLTTPEVAEAEADIAAGSTLSIDDAHTALRRGRR